jgi:hypothetical protein
MQQAQCHYKQLSGCHGKFYTDTLFSTTQSLQGHKMAQMYINDIQFWKLYPMKVKSKTPNMLSAFVQKVGIPSAIHSDDAKESIQG